MDYKQFFQTLQDAAKKMDLYIKTEIKNGQIHAWVYSNAFMTGTILELDQLLNLSGIDFKTMAAKEDLKTMADKLTEWGISPSEMHKQLDECLKTVS